MRRLPIILLALVGSCGLLSPRDVDYRQAALDETNRRETLWKGLAIHDYDFDFQRNCACSLKATQPVRIHVRGDAVTRVIDIQGGDVTPQADIPWPTVDSLFRWSRDLLNDRAFAVEMEFDTTYHLPKHIRGEDPGQSSVEHNSSNFFVQTGGAPAVVSYLIPAVAYQKTRWIPLRLRFPRISQ